MILCLDRFLMIGGPCHTYKSAFLDVIPMFETADELMRRKGAMAFERHALSWTWEGFRPSLVTYDVKRREVQGLSAPFQPGQALDLTVSEARRCVGSFGDAGYAPCMLRQVVSGQFDQCPICASTWIPVQACIFEPTCDGVHTECKGGSICAREHHVYAAFYGDLIKVGMTLSSRFMERAVEQGADAIVKLGSYPNRLEARKAENALSKALHATQWVRRTSFLRAQGARLDREAYQERLDRLLSALAGVRVEPEAVKPLNEYPLAPFDPASVSFAEVAGRHRGEVLGCKGKWLFYRPRASEVLMLEMARVPSRFITLNLGNHNIS